jgi:hypothetical protein
VTHVEWLGSREPAAPAALKAHLQGLFDQHPEWSALLLPEALAEAAELLLARVLTASVSSRSAATDLLSADACVTYAFEAATDDPASIAPLAERAMRRIAHIAAGGTSVHGALRATAGAHPESLVTG